MCPYGYEWNASGPCTPDPNSVHVAYYTQHGDETVDVDMASSHDVGNSFPGDRAVRR